METKNIRIFKRVGFWWLVSEAVPGVRSHVWKGYWSGLACLASGLVLTWTGRQPLRQREDIILPRPLTWTRMSNLISNENFLEYKTFHFSSITTGSLYYEMMTQLILFSPPSVGWLRSVPVVRIVRVFARAGAQREAWLLQCCSVLCQRGDCSP